MVIIRPAGSKDAAGIASVHIASWRTTYRGIVPDEVLANLSEERRAAAWQTAIGDHRQFTFVAEEDGAITGFANGGVEREGQVRNRDGRVFDCELYAIYLIEPSQNRGTGTQLFHAVAEELNRAGFRRLLVWVLTENTGARKFYEARGGIFEAEKSFSIGDAELSETAYGWDLPLA